MIELAHELRNAQLDFSFLYANNIWSDPDFVIKTILVTSVNIYCMYTHPLSDSCATNDNQALKQSIVTYTVEMR